MVNKLPSDLPANLKYDIYWYKVLSNKGNIQIYWLQNFNIFLYPYAELLSQDDRYMALK